MKKQSFVNCTIHFAVLLVVFGLSVTSSLCQTEGGAAQAEIAEMLKKHDDAMNKHDLDGVVVLYSSNPKTVMMGTGPGEKFQGVAEIRTAYAEMFKDFDKGTLDHTCYWKDGRSSGNVAWGGFMCKLADSKGVREEIMS
jgi:ketosteroid isomerase-like protein